MANFAEIISFFLFLQFCNATTIVEIQTKTGDDLFAGMGVNGKISLDICTVINVPFGGSEISCCQVHFYVLKFKLSRLTLKINNLATTVCKNIA
jgi:hypothetical protein